MIAGNAWGAFNALTERLDWYRSARGGSNESILASASGFDPAINAEKNRLLKIVQSKLQLVLLNNPEQDLKLLTLVT